MKIEALIKTDLPTIYAYTSAEIARRKISKGQTALIVVDEQDHPLGIVTAKDIFQKPYQLVADCLLEKPALRPGHNIYEAAQILVQRQEEAAPVYSKNGTFLGAILKDNLIEYLLRYSIHLENQLKAIQKSS